MAFLFQPYSYLATVKNDSENKYRNDIEKLDTTLYDDTMIRI